MRVVIQRVSKASVTVNLKKVAQINKGLLVLLGITDSDTQEDIDYLVRKIANLRIFNDENYIMNLSLKDLNADVIVVSQFTLYANTKKGN
ncbi:MAG: D-aminoacyl-tRNA deacylase, partial [Polaribacter sp.]